MGYISILDPFQTDEHPSKRPRIEQEPAPDANTATGEEVVIPNSEVTALST